MGVASAYAAAPTERGQTCGRTFVAENLADTLRPLCQNEPELDEECLVMLEG
jgi:hypothetical protein